MLRDNRDEYILKVLERKRITLVVREDLSGSTETMNNALRKFDGGWERFVMDSHSSVGWPRRDVPVSGAANMVLEVKKRSYSLGYVELSVANDYDAPFAYVINREVRQHFQMKTPCAQH
ncbi:hypothetical protein BC829DRAFT_124868 [Chytridium lagenaria]|nr:hypothetical protein BC829DRAFT_124868 [Chytridium lagenaria]